MKKKQFFSFGLYKEGLRRVRIPGIIFLALLTVAAVLVPISYVVSRSVYSLDNITNLTATNAHLFLYATIFVVAPILSWTLFSFLNKRNSSDFYHSLPYSRLCLFISAVASFVTWIAGIIVITSVVSRITVALFPGYLSVVPGTYLPYMIGCFAASILVGAIIILAMTITGTVLNNIVVAGLITFLPRFAISYIVVAVSERFPLMIDSYVSGVLSADMNILTGFFNVYSYVDGISLYNTASQIYTICLALLYFAIGAFLFCKRKSEWAEAASPTRLMQAVYRIILTMVICIPLCRNIFVGNVTTSYEIYSTFCGYIFAIIVYLLYELITTRKWKNLLRALPGLLVVLGLNIALLGAMYGIYRIEASFTPDADDVEYVSIVNDIYYADDFNEYAKKATSSIKLTDKDTIKIVTDALEENSDYLISHDYLYRYSSITSYYTSSSKVETDYTSCIVKIKSGLTTKYRRIYLTEEEYGSLSSALSSTEEYAKLWMHLPTPKKNSLGFAAIVCPSYELEEFYELMKNEVAGLEFEKWHEYIAHDQKKELGRIRYQTGGMEIEIPFAPHILPETSRAYIEIINRYSEISIEEAKELLTGDGTTSSDKINVSCIDVHHYLQFGTYYKANVSLHNSGGLLDDTYLGDSYGNDSLTIKEFASEYIDFDTPVDITKDFFVITFAVKSEYGYTNISQIAVPAAEDACEWLSDNYLIW